MAQFQMAGLQPPGTDSVVCRFTSLLILYFWLLVFFSLKAAKAGVLESEPDSHPAFTSDSQPWQIV